VLVGAFRSDANRWTGRNVHVVLHSAVYRDAFVNSVRISMETALLGGVIGVVVAYAALHPRAPRGIRPVVSAFSAIASQFGGVPLAMFFIYSIGNLGVVTQFLYDNAGYDLAAHNLTAYSYWGIAAAYIYFQIPLMVIVIAPAIDGMRQEWRDAAESLGAGALTYWLRIGIPVLMPAFLGGLILLFGNAFAAQATAYALNDGFNIVPLDITAVLGGNVQNDPHVGHALALGMILVIALVLLLYLPLERRAARWRR
jgi:putative spermidine/putrescine transport system permease protein